MKKDTYVAILAGFIIGLTVALGFVYLPRFLKNGLNLSFKLPALSFLMKKDTKIAPTQKPNTINELEIRNPKDGDISTNSQIEITGKGEKNSTIMISGGDEDQIVETTDGNFKVNFELNEGINSIYVTSVKNKDEYETKNITVFYTAEKL